MAILRCCLTQRKDEQAMPHEEKGTAMEAALQPVFERGFDGIGDVISAVLSEISGEWETGKIYLNTEGMPA